MLCQWQKDDEWRRSLCSHSLVMNMATLYWFEERRIEEWKIGRAALMRVLSKIFCWCSLKCICPWMYFELVHFNFHCAIFWQWKSSLDVMFEWKGLRKCAIIMLDGRRRNTLASLPTLEQFISNWLLSFSLTVKFHNRLNYSGEFDFNGRFIFPNLDAYRILASNKKGG